MTLKEIVENNPVLLSLSLLLVGFTAGITTYDAILRIAHLETVASTELKERDQTVAQLKQEALESSQNISTLTIEKNQLSYQIETEKRLLSSKMVAQLDGVWVNQNPNTGGITRFRIERRGDDVFVHAWGRCHPTDCDWGEKKAWIDSDSAIVLWDFPFEFVKMVIRLNKKTDLYADYVSVFTDDSGRKKQQTVEVFAYQNKPPVSEPSVPSPTPSQ